MVAPLDPKILPKILPKSAFGSQPSGATRRTAIGLILGAPLLGACAGGAGSLFNSQAGPSGPAEEAGAGRNRAGHGGIDPAAVGQRQCRRRGAIDEERRRDGAGGIPESQYPAS